MTGYLPRRAAGQTTSLVHDGDGGRVLHGRAADDAHRLLVRRHLADRPGPRLRDQRVAVGQPHVPAGPLQLLLGRRARAAVLPHLLAAGVHLDDEEPARAAVAVAAADERVAVGQPGRQVREWHGIAPDDALVGRDL